MNHTKILILTFLIILLFAQLGAAQQYKLNVGDQIGISVWGHPDLSRETSIDPDGSISYPLLGTIKAEGKTTAEIKNELHESLKKYIKNPVVSVNLLSYQKLKINVMGEVKQAGSFELRADNRVLDVISLAGGITEMAAAEKTILQRDGEKIAINLEKMIKGEDMTDNYLLKNNDQLYIPEKEMKTAFIQGEIRNPGSYQLDLDEEIRLNELLAEAGSITENAGDYIRIISNDQPHEFQIEETLAAKRNANPVIKDGDSVYIPSAVEEVTILGEIRSPGSYEWHDELRLANLIAQAGNTSDRANLENIRLVNKNGQLQEINMEEFFEENQMSANPRLQPGDLVMIGEKSSIDWSEVFFFFGGFNSIKDFFDW
ncbi:MAG: polysaccharide biosynthesis/export family protein [Halanaerobiales bacterium]|nr:polysaccharide biosynthesis/export family protein [Halanaerobiales bacterium]